MGVVIAVVAVVVLLAAWVTWTATRLDRLHSRVGAARAALDAQLVRRAAAARALLDYSPGVIRPEVATRLDTTVRSALDADEATREAAENDLGRVLRDIPFDVLPAERSRDLLDAVTRVAFARSFYNDAVRDTRALRGRRMPRLLRLAGRRPLPVFFEIDDTVPPTAGDRA